MADGLTGSTNRDWTVSVLMIFVGVAIGLVLTDIRGLLALGFGGGLFGWIWLVRKDATTPLAVFIALMPVWLYLKFLGWPPISVPGVESFIPTLTKEFFLLIWFLNAMVVAAQSEQNRLPIPKMLLAFFFVLLVMLPVVSVRRFPLLLRSYTEMFVLITVPLLVLPVNREDIHRILLGFLVAGGTFAAIGLYHYFIDPTLFLSHGLLNEQIIKGGERVASAAFLGPRLQSITANPNNLAGILLFTSVIALGLLHREKNNRSENLFAISVLIGCSFTLFLTRSRDDIVFLLIGFGLFFVIYRRVLPTMIGIIGGISGLFVMWDQVVGVFSRLLTRGNPRFDTWATTFETIGIGILTGGRSDAVLDTIGATDSTYLLMLLQIGAVGFGLFLFYNLQLIRGLGSQLLRQPQYEEATMFVLLIIMLFAFVFRVMFFSFPFTIYYWASIALSILFVREAQTKKRVSS